MESIHCIFCDVQDDLILIEENGYTGRQCTRCGLIYVSPRPTLDEIMQLYGHDSAHVSAGAHIRDEFAKRLYARHTLRILTAIAKGGTLLEIGAGAGYFLDEARKLGFDPYAVELNPLQANHVRSRLGIPCEESPLSSSLFGGRKFDVIYHCDVISHFFDPISEFAKMNDRLNEGGVMVFETGNLGDVDHSYLKYFKRFQYPDHLFFFSTGNLQDLLSRTGFELIEMHRYSILPQLATIAAVRKAAALVGRGASTPLGAGSAPPSAAGEMSVSQRDVPRPAGIVGNSWTYLNYFVRYGAGRVSPKARRPQTVIVAARKQRSG